MSSVKTSMWSVSGLKEKAAVMFNNLDIILLQIRMI